MKTKASVSEGKGRNLKTQLPAYVRVKFAKGRTYYYFETGEIRNGKRALSPLPAPGTAGFTRELKKAELARWRLKTRVIPPLRQGSPPEDDFDAAELTSGLTSLDDLYFIRAGDAVKIGRAADVFARLANMQANNHLELDCACRLPRRGHEERQWHAFFRDLWIRGEWFQWAPELAAAIDLARKEQDWWLGAPNDTGV